MDEKKILNIILFMVIVFITSYFLVVFTSFGLGILERQTIENQKIKYIIDNPPINYGVISEIKSLNSGGFLSNPSCLVVVNNKTISLKGNICFNIIEGNNLSYRDFKNIRKWSIN